jgi:hypothetical protein
MKNNLLIVFLYVIFSSFFMGCTNNSSENSATNTAKESSDSGFTCSICNNVFYHRGYQEASSGNWVKLEEPYQGFICSQSCGAKHTKGWNDRGIK